MRGSKAKRLRKLGLKSGPTARQVGEIQLKKIEQRIDNAKKPYSETRSTGSMSIFTQRVRERIISKRENSEK